MSGLLTHGHGEITGAVTCPESHSWEGAESGSEQSPLASRVFSLKCYTQEVGYILCGAQCKMKMQGPLFKICEFQVGDS